MIESLAASARSTAKRRSALARVLSNEETSEALQNKTDKILEDVDATTAAAAKKRHDRSPETGLNRSSGKPHDEVMAGRPTAIRGRG